jgi:hypothetical protein
MRIQNEQATLRNPVEELHPSDDTGKGSPGFAPDDFGCVRQPEPPCPRQDEPVAPVKDRRKLSLPPPFAPLPHQAVLTTQTVLQILHLKIESLLQAGQVGTMFAQDFGDRLFPDLP